MEQHVFGTRPHPTRESELLPEGEGVRDWTVILVAAAIFSALSAWMGYASIGFLEADGITHYLSRRFALDQPVHLVSVWNRPFCVILYAIPAKFGALFGTRLMSLVLVLGMMLITIAVAKRLKLARPALVAIFLLTQPLLFAHSFSELTEVPFALLMIAMFWCYAGRQWALLAVLAAMSPTARPEGFGLLLVAAVALVVHRRFWWLPILPLGLIVWSYAGWRLWGSPTGYPWWDWLPQNWPYSTDSAYGRGSPFRFIGILPAVVGPMAFPLVWLGAWRAFLPLPEGEGRGEGNRGRAAVWLGRFFTDHDTRCRILIALIPIGVLVIHSLLWALGKMASNGEARYMLVVAPFWALLAAMGWKWTCEYLRIRRPLAWTALAAIVPIAANIYYPVFPLGPQNDDRLTDQICAWIEERRDLRERYPILCNSVPHVWMQLDLDKEGPSTVHSSKANIQHPRDGVLMVWDAVYSTFNSDAQLIVPGDMVDANGWLMVKEFELGTYTDPQKVVRPRVMRIYLSPRDKNGNPSYLGGYLLDG